MRRITVLGLYVAAVTLVTAAPSSLAAQNTDQMAKWAAAQVIHYHVVGDFSGTTQVLKSKDGHVSGRVSDHVVIEFDWDQAQQKLSGDPVFTNFPTRVESLEPTDCAATKLNGPFEYFTFESVRAVAMMFEFQGKRELPPGVFQVGSEQGCGRMVQVPRATETVTARMQLALGMIIAMPAAAGEMEVSKDGKSIIQRINTDGWVWTMTPRIVR